MLDTAVGRRPGTFWRQKNGGAAVNGLVSRSTGAVSPSRHSRLMWRTSGEGSGSGPLAGAVLAGAGCESAGRWVGGSGVFHLVLAGVR